MSIGIALGTQLGRTVTGGGGAAATPFPKTLANLAAWYDASQITGLADGAAVAQWDDLSGNTLHAAQATGANQPTYQTGEQNGLPVVRFDGSEDNLVSPAHTWGTQLSLVVVLCGYDETPAGSQIAVMIGNYFPGIQVYMDNNPALWVKWNGDVAENGQYVTPTPAGATLVVAAFDVTLSAADEIRLVVNGGTPPTLPLGGGVNNTAALGSKTITLGRYVFDGNSYAGDICEAAFYDRALTEGEVDAWWAYADAKWDLSPEFSPATIPNLAAWYDASQITGLADGAAVPQWDDLSGNSHHATQATSGSRPTYQTAEMNGLPVVRFDGTNDGLVTNAIDQTGTQGVTVLVVCSAQASASDMALAETGADFFASNGWGILRSGTTHLLQGCMNGEGFSRFETAAPLATAPLLVTATFDRSLATGEVQVALNNAVSGSTLNDGNNTTNHPNTTVSIGCRGALASHFLNGDIAEIAVYTRVLTAPELAAWWAYADAKWGL